MASAGLRQCVRDITLYLVFLITITTLGPLQFGFHLSELNAPQDVITCKKKEVAEAYASLPDINLPPCIPMNEAQFAAISSMYVVGGLVGALIAGPLSTSYGRLLSMRASTFFFVAGSLVEAAAGTVPVISTGRFLSGIGAGSTTVIVPLYVSEIAPPRERGLFGSMTQVMINLGILITQTLGYFLSRASVWRLILVAGAGIGAVQGLGLLFVPESPAWLAAHKDPQRAARTLQRIRGADNSIDDEIEGWDFDNKTGNVEEERLLVDPEVEPAIPNNTPGRRGSSSTSTTTNSPRPRTAHVGFFQVVRDPLYRPAIVAVIGIMFAQQLCGINSIMMYSVSLLSGVLPINSSLLTLILSVINLGTTIACAPLPDKIGRKACLLLSIAGMGASSFLLACALRWHVKLLSAAAVILFVAFFATGLGPVPFMIASELVGQEAVGATQSWCLAANYTATFLVAQFFPLLNLWLNDSLGGKGWVFFVFAALAALSWLFVFWRVPETKGRRDADEVWGRVKVGRVD